MQYKNRRTFIKQSLGSLFLINTLGLSCQQKSKKRPNILVLMSDNQYAEHLGCYGDPVVKTPNIDRIAKSGIRFENAFCAAPSCTPARAGYLTGQDIWRLGEGANLHGTLPQKHTVFPDILEKTNYKVGFDGKGWGPGNFEAAGRKRNPGGNKHASFSEFFKSIPNDKSWLYWFCSRDPHRPFTVDEKIRSEIEQSAVKVPPYLPDNDTVRSDICDYYYEIQNFDKDVGKAISLLEQNNQIDNTIIVITSDNGWMMPRGLANLYDFGTKIPLIIAWKGHFPGNRVVSDFVNLNDLAPTFLELAGSSIPDEMTAKSLNNILYSDKSGRIDKERNFIVTARERHALVRKNGLGYPGRAIRTDDFLFIRNYEPNRWPAGDPPLYGDIDLHMLQGPTPTKEYMMLHKDDPKIKPLYEMAFLKRPAEELFDLKKDPWQMKNVADDPEYIDIKLKLVNQLDEYLKKTGDPRITGKEIIWDKAKYYQPRDFVGRPRKEAIELFNLKSEYPYMD